MCTPLIIIENFDWFVWKLIDTKGSFILCEGRINVVMCLDGCVTWCWDQARLS